VFGRKKKQEPEAPANEETDLAVAYGTGDEVKDDVSLTESVPPPPPGEATDAKNEDLSKEDSPTESPSVGAVDDADDSTDEKKAVEQIKRKKLILIASCIISFIILLALAIKYGQVRRSQAAKESATTLDSSATESSSSPGPTIVQVETAAPTTNATQVPTEFDPFAKCEANGISVLTTCRGEGGASVTFNFCLVEDVSDQFWEFVSTPPRVPQVIANDWAWLRDGASDEIPFLPDGTYEVGLFSNGEQNLQQYPLMNSTEFIVACNQEE